MKHLVIHPEDETTNFLKPIYAPLTNKMVISGGITKSELRRLIDVHDQILMLGHGSPAGLFSMGVFPDTGSYIIDDSTVNSLRIKTNSIFIWCNADRFIQGHSLSGLFSGMFISEIDEALYCGILDVSGEWIAESNDGFSSTLSQHINQPIDVLYEKLMYGYGLLKHSNPIAKYNHDRLFLKLPNTETNGSNQVYAKIQPIP